MGCWGNELVVYLLLLFKWWWFQRPGKPTVPTKHAEDTPCTRCSNIRRAKKARKYRDVVVTTESSQVQLPSYLGYGGQTKPVFKKKAKTTKKLTLRLECTGCKKKRVIVVGRCKTVVLMETAQIKNKNIGKKETLYA